MTTLYSVTQTVSTVYRGAAPGIDGGGARQRRHDAHRKVQKTARSPGMIYLTWIKHVIVFDNNFIPGVSGRHCGPGVADEGAGQGGQDGQDLGAERRPSG